MTSGKTWIVFGGLVPIHRPKSELMMDNVKLTTNIEYRYPFSEMFEGAVLAMLETFGFGDEFKFKNLFLKMGLVWFLDLHYRKNRFSSNYTPKSAKGERWVFDKIKPFKPTFNSIGYPFKKRI